MSEAAVKLGSVAHVGFSFECDQPAGVTWIVEQVSISESINDPYTIKLLLRTDSADAERLELLGQSCKLILDRGSYFRQYTGIIASVEESVVEDVNRVAITVVPALHTLKLGSNTKIFQNLTVPQILEQVLHAGLSPYKRTVDNRCTRSYPKCEYRVQYNESDFTFCERLMEQEGIAYWFEFEGEEEVMVLADAPGAFSEVTSLEGPDLLFSQYTDTVHGHEQVTDFSVDSVLLATKATLRHFDWTHPSVVFMDESNQGDSGGDGRSPNGAMFGPEREIYEHDEHPITLHQYSAGGGYGNNDQRDQTMLRRQAHARAGRLASGTSTVTDVKAGGFITLVGHPQSELDGRYLVVDVDHSFSGSGERSYINYFRCIPESVPYRPRLLTPRPHISSIQTATVVGPAGEEIHTDEHGRIKVQFHWDRLGARDEHSSCWVRVMQPWAGAGWGFVFIPRIGMEVVVNFVDGDPDRPLIVGSVYNGDNPPPYTLPDEKTKSTIKTSSSLGGGGYNELRFEDKAGSEEIFTHAQKDYNEVVENDHNTVVHHDQTNTVDNNQTEIVHVDQSLTVDRHRTKTVVGNETTTVQGNRTESVTGDETISIASNRTESVTGNETISIASNRSESVSGNETISIGASRSVSVAASDELSVGGSRSMSVSGSVVDTITAAYQQSVLGAHNVSVGGLKAEEVGLIYKILTGIDYSVDAGKSITLKTGSSEIVLKEDGTIDIKGVKITIDGTSLIKLKSAKIEQNC